MLKLPKQTMLPGNIREMLNQDCRKLLRVPKDSAGGAFVFHVPSLVSLDGRTLTLSLPQEHNDLGRGLVRSLWFSLPLTLWLQAGDAIFRAEAQAYRCHIAGPDFVRMLSLARKDSPCGDIACAWQLIPEGWVPVNHLPSPTLDFPQDPPELHFDNPLLRK